VAPLNCELAYPRREDMSKDSSNSYERRLYPRVELMRMSIPAEGRKSARIIDISASGAQVEFPTPLVPGNLYEIRLTFPDRQISVRARVTRSLAPEGSVRAADSGTPCLAGLEFIGLDTEDQRYLEGYVAGQSQL
jgi:hypothetical protein